MSSLPCSTALCYPRPPPRRKLHQPVQNGASRPLPYREAFLENFYVGDSDLFEEWATLVREALHQQVLNALTALVAYHERLETIHRHCSTANAVGTGPLAEEAYRQTMRLLALNGQRSAALHYYERCRAMLDKELCVEPSAETTALYEQIRAATLDVPLRTEYFAPHTKRHHNLPLQPTPFIGRQRELVALAELIADPQCRLITLLGPGGTGKTRLALQVASDESEAFADGTTFVTLAPLNAAEFIVPTVAAALNVTLASHAAPKTELLRYLRQKELLLVLDNFEHLLAPLTPSPVANGNGSATELLSGILQQAPGVKLLVTSRERLNLQGEWVFDVGGLETPTEPFRAGEERSRRVRSVQCGGAFPADGAPRAERFRADGRRSSRDRAYLPTGTGHAAGARTGGSMGARLSCTRDCP